MAQHKTLVRSVKKTTYKQLIYTIYLTFIAKYSNKQIFM